MFDVATALSAAQLGLSLYSATQSEGLSRSEKDEITRKVRKQIENLKLQKEEFGKLYSSKRGIITSRYGANVKTLYDRVGESFRDINQKYETMVGDTGMAFSGTVYNISGAERRSGDIAFKDTRGSLYDQYRSNLLDTNMQEKEKIAEIDTQISNLRLQHAQMMAS